MDIHIRHLIKRYRHNVIALNGVDLDIPGGMFGLLGANGAGKTTLMRILAGVLTPSEGTITIGDIQLRKSADRRRVQRHLGYLPQDLGVYPELTCRAFLDYIAVLKGITDTRVRRRNVSEVLDVVALSDVAHRKTGKLSGGMKRRLGIAQALLGDPRLLIVDEPTAGLDPEERIRFRTLLSALAGDRTVILSTHIVEDIAATCRNLAVLSNGRIIHVGHTDGLIDAARGRTWLIDLPVGAPPPPGHVVVSALATGPTVTHRLVGDLPPAGAQPVDPTLEDGYLALMRSN